MFFKKASSAKSKKGTSRKGGAKKRGTQKSTSRKKTGVFELTRKELFLWLGVAFLALVWMFTLGVIVGRGLSPVHFDVEKLTKELMALKEAALKADAGGDKTTLDFAREKQHLGFYDVLTDKKEEAWLKSMTNPPKQPAWLNTNPTQETADKSKPNIPRKTSVSKKEKLDVGSSVATPASSEKSYSLQVASLKDLSQAKKMVATLKAKGYRAFSTTAHVSGKTYHRVRVGHFKDRDGAKSMAFKLMAEKYEPIVIRE